MQKRKIAPLEAVEFKRQHRKIRMVTAYDYATASSVNRSEIEIILVGDSLGMVVLGYDSTLPVTMDDMLYHLRPVVKAAPDTMVVADMPFLSYHLSVEQALSNGGSLMRAGADAVKIEGGAARCPAVKALVDAGIPVMGHLGLTPQAAAQLGGFRVQGKSAGAARTIVEDAIALQEAGVFAIVLEAVPHELARIITERLVIPTIGIGAGPECDGQVLVIHDMLGWFDRFRPRFVKQYANIGQEIDRALAAYAREVADGSFPQPEHCFNMKEGELKQLLDGLQGMG
ncbi:MAG: 3-methyl-2-oxobutanoate hydroxymethyltransferase [Bacillota bacterium]